MFQPLTQRLQFNSFEDASDESNPGWAATDCNQHLVGTRQQLDKLHITELQLQSANDQFADTVSDLGVVVDSQLNMSAHVTAVSRSC